MFTAIGAKDDPAKGCDAGPDERRLVKDREPYKATIVAA